jgi:hypothetical protein
MDKEKMRNTACLILVDMAADGADIYGMALELRMAFAFGTEEQFRKICGKIGAAYKNAEA